MCCVSITELNVSEKLQLERYLERFGEKLLVRHGNDAYDVSFNLFDGIKLVAGSDNITLVDDQSLNFITIDRSAFLEAKIL